MNNNWIAQRMSGFEVSGIRKVFDLGRSLQNPINLSIGQPAFDVPEPIKDAAKAAIDAGHNGYTPTQGIAELRAKLEQHVQQRYKHADRELFITSGTSGGIALAILCTVNPGDEVIIFDPYFVMYPQFVRLANGVPVFIDTYPDFAIDIDKVKNAITERTKVILVNSPANPTGAVTSRETLRALALLAKEKDILLISDEVYRVFHYDDAFCSPAEFNDDTLVVDGFSKAYGMTGWRLGFAHGPRALVDEMLKLQQYTYVCAPHMVQHAGVVAWDYDISETVAKYQAKRDRIYDGLKDRFELIKPGGAFYLFAKAPWRSRSRQTSGS